MGKALRFDPERKPEHHSIPSDEKPSIEVAQGNFPYHADPLDPEAYAKRREEIEKKLDPWIKEFSRLLKVYLTEVALGNAHEDELAKWAQANLKTIATDAKKLP